MTNAAERVAAVTTKAEADALLVRLTGTMDAIVHVLEAETTLVRAGKLRDAERIQADKAELTRRYMLEMRAVQSNAAALKSLSPEKIARLRESHDAFRANLRVNMTVLETAHALAEGLVREVAQTMEKAERPAAYGAKGAPAAPRPTSARPVALNRSL